MVTLTKWGIIAGIALFCALMGAAVIPAVFPQAAILAEPLLCPGGVMTTESETFYPEPGRTVISRYFFCTDEGGTRRELSTLLTVGACTAMGFLPALLVVGIFMGRAKAEFIPGDTLPGVSQSEGTLADRMKELAAARDSGLITEEDFERKKQEMLDAL
jgi:hypothetical protein